VSSDFLVHSVISPTTGLIYVVTPQNTRALCWMIARTSPSQRPEHTAANLDSEALLRFLEQLASGGLSFENRSPIQKNRITLIPGQPVLARFSGPHAAEIREVFTTDIIPTAYDSRGSRPDILEAIRRQNPTAIVEWETG
jgi:hypothetical protein